MVLLTGQYDQGGVMTANKKIDNDETTGKRRTVFKESNWY